MLMNRADCLKAAVGGVFMGLFLLKQCMFNELCQARSGGRQAGINKRSLHDMKNPIDDFEIRY